MKTILAVMLFSILIACGQQETSQQSNYTHFINSHNGVEFKAPSKIELNYAQNNQNYDVSDILLSIDSDGTYHLRSDIPSGNLSTSNELQGINGEWEVTGLGELKLYQDGLLVAESGLYNTNGESSYTLNFVQPIGLDIVRMEVVNGFGGYGDLINYSVINYTVVGYQLLTRK